MAKIVIVGLGAGGFAAILSARKTDRDAEITVIDEKDYDLMHPCGIPYAVEGAIGSISNLKHDLNLKSMRVAHFRTYRATFLDTAAKTLSAICIFSGEEITANYDKLILATGASPFIPPVMGLPELMGKGAYTCTCPEDAERIRKEGRTLPATVIIGAGAIGLELAHALSERGCSVTVVEMLDHVFPKALDPDMAAILESYLAEKGITLKMKSSVNAVRGDGKVEAVEVDGVAMPCSLVVVGAGNRPNTDLAAAAGIKTEKLGIVTDEKMMTSDPNVFAVGDCALSFDAIRRNPCAVPLSTIAYRQGTIAGSNAAGADVAFSGITGAFVSKVGDMEVAAVGMTTAAATAAGFNPVFGKIKDLTRPDWYPNGREINVKVIVDRDTRKVLGAQAVGAAGAAWRINVVSAAISAGMTVEQLSEIELAYCPPVSQTYDALTKAADLAIRKIR